MKFLLLIKTEKDKRQSKATSSPKKWARPWASKGSEKLPIPTHIAAAACKSIMIRKVNHHHSLMPSIWSQKINKLTNIEHNNHKQ